MKKTSSQATALSETVTTTAYVRLLITGICALITDNEHTPLLAVMPDGREPRLSATDPALQIPSHHAFVMFPAASIVDTEPHRDADYFVSGGDLAVCLLEDEMLSLAGGSISGVASSGSSTEIVRMPDVCVHAKAQPAYTTFPPAAGVLAQVQVPSNALVTNTASEHTFTFEPPCAGVTTPQSGNLAEVVQVDLQVDDASTLQLVSHPFSGGAAMRPIVLSLDGTTYEAPLEVTIGNVPLPDLLRYVGDQPAAPHGDRDVHFELYYTLVANIPQPPPIPIMHMMVPHASNCPSAIMPTGEA
jgi:hypothetical protein